MNINIEKTNIIFNFYIRKYNNMVRRIRLTPSPNSGFKLFSILCNVVRHSFAKLSYYGLPITYFVQKLYS